MVQIAREVYFEYKNIQTNEVKALKNGIQYQYWKKFILITKPQLL